MRNAVCCLFLLIFSANTFSVNNNLILADSFPDKLSEFEFFVDDSAQEPHEKVIPVSYTHLTLPTMDSV